MLTKPYLEFEWTVGPIPDQDKVPREIISRFDTSVANDKVFWTDANGRQMMKRTRNFQETYTYIDSEPVAGNYYPVTSRIAIQDKDNRLAILNDRSQAGGSINDGSIEFLIHRRSYLDDWLGVGEALNEPGTDGKGLVARGRHWLLLSDPSKANQLERQSAMEMFHEPVSTFAPVTGTFDAYRTNFNTIASAVGPNVPRNANFLTVAKWEGSSTILLRLEHLYQKNEDPELSKPASISLKDHLPAFDISSIEELSLSGLKSLGQVPINQPITLQPMQIRTLRCTVRR